MLDIRRTPRMQRKEPPFGIVRGRDRLIADIVHNGRSGQVAVVPVFGPYVGAVKTRAAGRHR
jgi:uncharacterized protein (DUF3084 family)